MYMRVSGCTVNITKIKIPTIWISNTVLKNTLLFWGNFVLYLFRAKLQNVRIYHKETKQTLQSSRGQQCSEGKKNLASIRTTGGAN